MVHFLYSPMTFTVHVDFHFDLFAGETTILELFPELMTWSQTIKVCLTGWQLGYQKQTTYKLSMTALQK